MRCAGVRCHDAATFSASASDRLERTHSATDWSGLHGLSAGCGTTDVAASVCRVRGATCLPWSVLPTIRTPHSTTNIIRIRESDMSNGVAIIERNESGNIVATYGQSTAAAAVGCFSHDDDPDPDTAATRQSEKIRAQYCSS